jgi:hypothetical protein
MVAVGIWAIRRLEYVTASDLGSLINGAVHDQLPIAWWQNSLLSDLINVKFRDSGTFPSLRDRLLSNCSIHLALSLLWDIVVTPILLADTLLIPAPYFLTIYSLGNVRHWRKLLGILPTHWHLPSCQARFSYGSLWNEIEFEVGCNCTAKARVLAVVWTQEGVIHGCAEEPKRHIQVACHYQGGINGRLRLGMTSALQVLWWSLNLLLKVLELSDFQRRDRLFLARLFPR